MFNLSGKKIVLTHHWMLKMRGGEKVLEQFCLLFPDANIQCLVFDRQNLSDTINRHQISASFLQKSDWAKNNYKQMLPLHPLAVSSMSVPPDTDVVICSDAAMIKGVRLPERCKLICYCHSPPRYLWDMAETYANQSDGMGFLKRSVFRAVIPYCKRFDYRSAQRVDHFIANSHFVAERIKRHYGKDSDVVYPPVAIEDFDHSRRRSNFYLVVSELVPYKRVDIAIEAFQQNGLPLVVIGDGSERRKLEAKASSNIQFLGTQPFSVLKEHFETCRAFVFPGVEDFGITPVEAQAAGAPVVAFAQGGVLETVVDLSTGRYFDTQHAAALNSAIDDIERMVATDANLAERCRKHVEPFSRERFRTQFSSLVQELTAS